MTTTQLSLAEAQTLLTDALTANGVPSGAALHVAEALAAAEAEGQVGHGFSRLEDYIAQARSGKIRADAEVRVEAASTTGLLVDAGHGFAYPALATGIDAAMNVAEAHGTATLAVTRSHHCGALSVQVDRIARRGFIGLMMVNTPAAIAPWGARTPVFGTNPIAFAAPRRGQEPLVIDLSLSVVARGKVMAAKKAGRPIPEGWALDANGEPTTDPDAALAGSMVAIGDAKGAALALIVEIFAAAMSGAALSSEASSFFAADGPPPGVGQFVALFKPTAGADVFAERLETLSAMILGMEGTRLPGDRRRKAIAAAREHGLAVPDHLVATARRLASVRA